MRFDIITIFPHIFESYFNESILKRAKKNKLIDVEVHNLRDYASDKHHTTDDTPYGGGAGMVMKVEPIYNCVNAVKSQIPISNFQINPKSKIKNKKVRTILFSAKGKRYTQADARRLSKYDRLILICGRYEGVDERVAKHIADEEIAIGEYVLTGGEIPAMVIVDSLARLIPGVLGNEASSQKESHKEEGYLEHPQYTKPEEFSVEGGASSYEKIWKVPQILLSGNHAQIEDWRKKNAVKGS